MIVVAGTHGKTTTTAMVIDVLEAANLDPRGWVGSLRTKTKSNFRDGKGKYFVGEADEYRRHFLSYWPKILVITNIDADHLDYYKDLVDIQSAFQELAERVPADGFIVCNEKDSHIIHVLKNVQATVIDYAQIADVPKLQFPGNHNIQNAQAALGVAEALRIERSVADEALAAFEGTARRFEFRGTTAHGALVYDDYGHNPQKVVAALQGARELYPDRKIFVVFQPHLFSRTKLLFTEFSKSFSGADDVVVLPIYAAREKDDGTVSSADLAAAITQNGTPAQALDFKAAAVYLQGKLSSGDVVMTLGAGEAFRVGDELLLRKAV